MRISSDRTGAGLGVARQEEDCRALCQRMGWTVVHVYPDNDVSAYSGKPRPQWTRLLADVTAGIMDAVVCWHVDRLTRSPRANWRRSSTCTTSAVRDKVLTALDSPDFLAALLAAAGGDAGRAEDIRDQLRAIDTRREELARTWAAGDISRKEWLAARDALTTEADQLTAELSRSQHGRALAAFAAPQGTPWDRWATMTTGARRALIHATAAAFPVRPATARTTAGIPARIGAPAWRA